MTGEFKANGGVVFNEDSADVDFRVEGNSLTHALFVDGETDNVMIGTSVAGRAAEGADRLTIADAAHSGMTIRSGTGSYGSINFSDSEGGAGEYAGQIWYGHGGLGDKLVLATQGSNRVTVTEDLTIEDGDLKIGTGGHGISFATTSDASGMTSEVLDDYEEGTWTPTLPQGGTVNQIIDAHYVKIGLLVQYYTYISITPTNNSNIFRIGGIPYTPIQYNHGGGSIQYSGNLDTHYWSGPLVHHDGYVYFHRLDGNSASIVNSAFGGSQTSLIVHGVYSIL